MLLKNHIDYKRDQNLSAFGLATLKDRYLKPFEDSPQELYMRAATAWGSNKQHSLRIYDYASKGWFGFASPTISNAPIRTNYLSDSVANFSRECFESTDGALPISCFTGFVGDNREEIANHYYESVWLASNGGGYKAAWSALRPINSSTSTGSKTGGLIPFYHVMDGLIIATHQGNNRRGVYGGACDVSHVEIIEFISSRKMSGDPNKRSRNIFQTVNIPDIFMYAVLEDAMWGLKDHQGNVVKTIKARALWEMMMDMPFEIGCPFIMWSDTAYAGLPMTQKKLGLRVNNPNICTEITLATNKDRTAVCCLCSPNAAKYDEWKDHPQFISDLTEMLDNILEYFIQNAMYACTKDYDWDKLYKTIKDSMADIGIELSQDQIQKLAKDVVEKNIMGYKKAVYSAKRERAIGIGLMGLDTYFMQNEIAYESNEALALTKEITSNIKANFVKASKRLAIERGEPEDMIGSGMRNSHGLAIAPTATNSIIVNVTAALEKCYENIYTQKTKSGTFEVINPALLKVLERHEINTPEIRKSVADQQGSVQHLEKLTDHERLYLRTSFEIDQRWVVEHAAVAQESVCQAISVNLFFKPETPRKYVNNVHLLMWKRGLKTRYYVRTKAVNTADAFAEELIKTYNTIDYAADFGACVACEA